MTLSHNGNNSYYCTKHNTEYLAYRKGSVILWAHRVWDGDEDRGWCFKKQDGHAGVEDGDE